MLAVEFTHVLRVLCFATIYLTFFVLSITQINTRRQDFGQ